MSDSLRPHRLQHARLPCPSPTPGAYTDSYPLSRWCHPAVSSSVIPFSSCIQSFPRGQTEWRPQPERDSCKTGLSCFLMPEEAELYKEPELEEDPQTLSPSSGRWVHGVWCPEVSGWDLRPREPGWLWGSFALCPSSRFFFFSFFKTWSTYRRQPQWDPNR